MTLSPESPIFDAKKSECFLLKSTSLPVKCTFLLVFFDGSPAELA
jgi:hypothetical protein